MLWLHVLAVGYSPLYLEENGDAIRNDWPRVPLPPDFDRLASSVELGRRIANLLDLDVSDAAADADDGVSGYQRTVARIERVDGKPLATDDGDLALTAGWAIEQRRTQRSGAVSRIVIPGAGRVEIRERTDTERQPMADEQLNILGARVVDVHLNDRVRWRGVPEAAWDFKIGGFQVLRKWLSYREKPILGRDLTTAEARTFTAIARRLTALALLGPKLDANYLRVVDPR